MTRTDIPLEYGSKGIAAFSLQPEVVDTGMQGRIRESGMNEISRLPRSTLAPPEHAAAVMAWLCDRRPEHHVGKELSVRDEHLVEESRAAQPPTG